MRGVEVKDALPSKYPQMAVFLEAFSPTPQLRFTTASI